MSAAAGITAKNVHVNGVRLNIEEAGSGQPLIMLHGLASNVASLRNDLQAFSDRYRTIAIDCRGHGLSDHPPSFTLADHFADVLAVMDALGIESTCLIGSSMGSYVAQGVAFTAPERVKKLVLVTPKAHGARSSSEEMLKTRGAHLAKASPDEPREFLRSVILAPTTPERRAALFAEMERSNGPVMTAAQTAAVRKAMENFDLRPQLPRISAQTLVISGRHDPLNPPAEGKVVADLIPGSRFEIFEHSGHVPRLEEREVYLKRVGEFLAH